MKHTKTKLRLYAFCNFYMNSISQGIQTAHVIGRMADHYRFKKSDESNLFWDWLTEHQDNETIIVCNGGMAADVYEAFCKFENVLSKHHIPSRIFYEEPRALGVAGSTPSPTCWACVLPESVYAAKRHNGDILSLPKFVYTDTHDDQTIYTDHHDMFEFLTYKNNCGLAR